jgi:tRNA A-37 threonylcarbamoyl transferase component Bud32
MPSLSRRCTRCNSAIADTSLVCTQCGADAPTFLTDDRSAVTVTEADPIRDRLQETLGPAFVVEDRLGAGGFGLVYRANDLRLRRDVAVKVLRCEMVEDPQFVQRFEFEARSLAKLRHPHIVPIFSIGEHEDLIYIVMPFISGGSLTKYLQEKGPLPLNEVVRLLTAVGSALSAAHAAGLVHRDVKPDNIMLDGEAREPMLMDFGIAKASSGHSAAAALTAIGTVLGTTLYMSPEQARGEEVDRRSDIYSLGIVAYEMLTGSPPYCGESFAAVASAHLFTPIPESRARRPEIPPAMSDALKRAMAKEPSDRFQEVDDFVRAIGGAPVRWRPGRARWQRVVEVAAFCLVLVAGAEVLWQGMRPVRRTAVQGTVGAGVVRFRLADAQSPWEQALALHALGLSGIETASIPAAGPHPAIRSDAPTLFLEAVSTDSGDFGEITIDPIRLPSRSVIAVRPSGQAGVSQLSIGDSVSSLPVSVKGRIAVRIPDRPVDTLTFTIDRIDLTAPRGPVDLDLTWASPAKTAFLAPLRVVGVSFDDVNRFRDEDAAGDERVSTIVAGSVRIPGRGAGEHVLSKGDDVPFHGFQGTLRNISADSTSVRLTLDGTIDSLPRILGAMPTRLESTWAAHPALSLLAAGIYLVGLLLLPLKWRRAR